VNLADPVRFERAAGWLELDGYRPEYARQAYRLACIGLESTGIAEFFEVDGATFEVWRAQHPEFARALERGAVTADVDVAAALYRTAVGHERTETRIVGGQVVAYTVHVPANVRACMFWLERRRPEEWSVRREVRVDAGHVPFVLTTDDAAQLGTHGAVDGSTVYGAAYVADMSRETVDRGGANDTD